MCTRSFKELYIKKEQFSIAFFCESYADKATFELQVFDMDFKTFTIFMLFATVAFAQNNGNQDQGIGDLLNNLPNGIGNDISDLLDGKFQHVCESEIMLDSMRVSVHNNHRTVNFIIVSLSIASK